MSRVSFGFVGLLALGSLARADEEPVAAPTEAVDSDASTTRPKDARAQLSQLLAAEGATLATTSATVAAKLAAVDTERGHRLAAAYRILRAPAPSAADPIAAARRRAAARWLVQRDLGERRLLADEQALLASATARTAADATRVTGIALPTMLAWPAKGTVARHFGTLVHERSKATLARRGVDLEVATHAEVSAPEAGVVRYAGPIRGLDHGILLDHGTYWTVVGKLGDLVVPVGAHVARGDRLGRAARSRVYFEVRVKVQAGGLPIDPEPLLSVAAE